MLRSHRQHITPFISGAAHGGHYNVWGLQKYGREKKMLSEKRKGRVTASLVGAILGCAPYMTRDDAMRLMVREQLGATREFEGSVATEYGTAMEKAARFDFELKTGLDVDSKNEFFMYMGDYFIGATPDGLTSDGATLEIKCPFGLRNTAHPHFKTLEDQPHYKAQVHVQMACTDRNSAYFYQWTPSSDFLEKVYFDREYFAVILEKCTEFYEEFLLELKAPAKYLEPKIKTISAPQFSDAYIKAKADLEVAQENLEKCKNDLIKLADGQKSNINGLLVYQVEREGSVSYAKALKDLAPTADLSVYKGQGSSYWVVK